MNLFEVCAVLTMDTAAFEESVKNAVRQGEQLEHDGAEAAASRQERGERMAGD